MVSIHPEVQDFVDEDETNYETDEINKENMNELSTFIADQKSEKYITCNKIRQANLVQVLSKEERVERSKIRIFSSVKFCKKEKWRSVQTCNPHVFSTKHSVAPQPKGFNGEFAKRRRL